jgi:hypothetical protein
MKVCTRCGAEHKHGVSAVPPVLPKRCAMPIWVPGPARYGVLPPSSSGARRDRMHRQPRRPMALGCSGRREGNFVNYQREPTGGRRRGRPGGVYIGAGAIVAIAIIIVLIILIF